MTFRVEFYAADRMVAHKILERQYLPESIRHFINIALTGCPAATPVYVKAFGHLFSGDDHNWSDADIKVHPIIFKEPDA